MQSVSTPTIWVFNSLLTLPMPFLLKNQNSIKKMKRAREANEALDQLLLAAAHDGDLARAQALLEQGATPNAKDDNGKTLLQMARMVKFLVQNYDVVHTRDKNGDTPLHWI